MAVPTEAAVDSTVLAKLNGFLTGFALLNTGCNHGSDYCLEVVPWRGDAAESLQGHFQGAADKMKRALSQPWKLSLEPRAGGLASVRPIVEHWLFTEYLGPSTPTEYRPREQIADDWRCAQENASNLLLEGLRQALGTKSPEVWELKAEPPSGVFYELVWTDLVFAARERQQILLLHFGFSD